MPVIPSNTSTSSSRAGTTTARTFTVVPCTPRLTAARPQHRTGLSLTATKLVSPRSQRDTTPFHTTVSLHPVSTSARHSRPFTVMEMMGVPGLWRQLATAVPGTLM